MDTNGNTATNKHREETRVCMTQFLDWLSWLQHARWLVTYIIVVALPLSLHFAGAEVAPQVLVSHNITKLR